MLDLRNLIDMLQRHRAHGALDRVPHSGTTRRCLALLPIVVVHGSGHVTSTPDFVLLGRDAGSGEEQGCGGWCAQLEVEGAVWADCYACGDRGADCVVGGAGVEFLGWVVRTYMLCRCGGYGG